MHTVQTPPRIARRGFTLIELLVVIAIIAILAAILFPVFAQAKLAAKKTTAISNAKQLDLAQIMYSGDYDDVFTPYFSGLYITPQGAYDYTAPSNYWPQLISAYVQKVTGTGAGGANGTTQQAETQDLPKVFFDPVEPFKTQLGDKSCPDATVASWGISDDITNWWEPDGVATTYLPVNQTQVGSPATALVLVETYDWICGENYPGSTLALSYFDDNATYTQPYNGSNNGAKQTLQSPYNATYPKTGFNMEPDPKGFNNVAFCDGHVKSINTGQLTHSGQYWSIGGNNLWP